jgi:hypothetical protein
MRGHGISGLCALLALVVAAGSCTGKDADQPVIPARPGAYQPPGGGDPVSEDEACQRLVAAEEAARRRMQCQPLDHPECPFYVRPAGTGCWRYDSETVERCEDFVNDYTACADFTDRPCVLTAIPAPDSMCPPLGAGAGGEGGGGSGGGGSGAAAGEAGSGPSGAGAGGSAEGGSAGEAPVAGQAGGGPVAGHAGAGEGGVPASGGAAGGAGVPGADGGVPNTSGGSGGEAG